MTDLSQLMARHRSIRAFTSAKVEESILRDAITDAIKGSPSHGNMQCASVVIATEADRKRALFELNGRQPMALDAPAILTFCADCFRVREWLRLRGAEDNFDNFAGFLMATIDTAIFAQSTALALEDRGLGTCFMGSTMYNAAPIAALLGLPETCVPIAALAVGYPKESPVPRYRIGAGAIIHKEQYQVPTGQDIDAIYAEDATWWSRACEVNPEVRHIAENTLIQNLAQLYTSVFKYPEGRSIESSEAFLQLLREKRFL